MEIKIIKMGINGEGIGYLGKKPVFVTGAFPGETAEVKILKDCKTYQLGQSIRIIERSPKRVESVCRNEQCQACTLISMDYPEQLLQKKALLSEALYKYAEIPSRYVDDVKANPQPLKYRNQLKLPVRTLKDRLVTGMFEPQSNHFVPIEKCIIHDESLEKLRQDILKVLNKNKVKSYDAKVQQGIRFMILRGFDHHFQCTLVTGDEPLNESVADELINIPDLVSLNQSINTTKDSYELFGSQVTCLRGSKGIDVQLGQYHYRLSPKAFFQLNVYQAEKIYLQVASHIKNAGLVVDAYCGIGSMTMFLKDQAKRVIGIENNKDAIRDAVVTARLNNAVNCEFIAGDAAEQLKRISQKHSIDVLVVNPPRSGMSDDMLESVMLTKAKQLLYVSCNPSTLAKNLAVLGKHYRIDKISPFDMFSYTPLVETVVSLYRK